MILVVLHGSFSRNVRVKLDNIFTSFIQNQFGTSLKCLRTDNENEFLMTNFLNAKGILHQRSCVECPHQNGLVEREHQHILNVARALSFQANLPKHF